MISPRTHTSIKRYDEWRIRRTDINGMKVQAITRFTRRKTWSCVFLTTHKCLYGDVNSMEIFIFLSYLLSLSLSLHLSRKRPSLLLTLMAIKSALKIKGSHLWRDHWRETNGRHRYADVLRFALWYALRKVRTEWPLSKHGTNGKAKFIREDTGSRGKFVPQTDYS